MSLRPYEVVYIIDPDLNPEETEATVERFRAVAEAQGVQELRVDTNTLGRRKLAYAINHKRDGLYVVMHFVSGPAAPVEVERVLRISDSILRTLVVRLEEMPPEPVAPPHVEPVAVAAPVQEAPVEEAPAEEAAAEEAPAEEAPAEEAPAEDQVTEEVVADEEPETATDEEPAAETV